MSTKTTPKTKTSTKLATRPKTRERVDFPAPGLVDLAGLDKIQGQGDNMKLPGRGELQFAPRTKESAHASTTDYAPGGYGGSGGAQTTSNNHPGHITITPIAHSQALIGADADPNLYVRVNGVNYTTALLLRRENGSWVPLAPFAVRNEQGQITVGKDAATVFDILTKAVELYYRARYMDFVYAEWVWVNNTIKEFEDMSTKIAAKKAKPQEREAFYAIRFSGQIGALRQQEAEILKLLQRS